MLCQVYGQECVTVEDFHTLESVCILCGSSSSSKTSLPPPQSSPAGTPRGKDQGPEELLEDLFSLPCLFQNENENENEKRRASPKVQVQVDVEARAKAEAEGKVKAEAEALSLRAKVEAQGMISSDLFQCPREVKNPKNLSIEQWETKTYVAELCAKLYLSGEGLAQQFVQDYVVMKRQWCQWLLYLEMELLQPACQLHHYHRQQNELITLSIYKSFQNLGTARSLKEIASVTRADMKRLWKVQRQWEERLQALTYSPRTTVTPMVLTPQDLLRSRLGYLGLGFQHFKTINQGLKATKHYQADFASHTIAGAAMYSYGQSLPLSLKLAIGTTNLTKKSCAALFHTTSMSIFRYETFLKKHNVSFGFKAEETS